MLFNLNYFDVYSLVGCDNNCVVVGVCFEFLFGVYCDNYG